MFSSLHQSIRYTREKHLSTKVVFEVFLNPKCWGRVDSALKLNKSYMNKSIKCVIVDKYARLMFLI